MAAPLPSPAEDMDVSFMCCSKAAVAALTCESLAAALRIEESGLRVLDPFCEKLLFGSLRNKSAVMKYNTNYVIFPRLKPVQKRSGLRLQRHSQALPGT